MARIAGGSEASRGSIAGDDAGPEEHAAQNEVGRVIADLTKRFADTLERVCVETVETGFMTKDLALLVGADQKWLSTTGFLDKIDENLKAAMAA